MSTRGILDALRNEERSLKSQLVAIQRAIEAIEGNVPPAAGRGRKKAAKAAGCPVLAHPLGDRPALLLGHRALPPAYRLATTLLDPAVAPAAEIAALYHERWEVETAYDEVKTHILGPGAILRSKTPDLVLQEVHGLMLAHYAVRRLIHEGGAQGRRGPGPSLVRPRGAGRAPPCREPRRFPPCLRMIDFVTACWTRFSKSGWSRVAARRNPAASSAR